MPHNCPVCNARPGERFYSPSERDEAAARAWLLLIAVIALVGLGFAVFAFWLVR